VTDVNKHAHDTDVLDTLSRRVMVGDGALGTQLQAVDLWLEVLTACAEAVQTKYVRLQSG
jgi:methionine synthase I (cobalamin-dependent)